MLARVLVIIGAVCIAIGFASSVQAQNTVPNGFVESPQCAVKANHWEQIAGTSSYRLKNPRQEDGFNESAHMILIWYYGGAEAMSGLSPYNVSKLSSCYQEYKVDGCERAIPADKKIYRALDNLRAGRASKSDQKRLDALFNKAPPAGLIAYAAEELGACFGSDPAQPSLKQIDWVEVTPSEAECKAYLGHRWKQFKNVSYLRPERNLDAWSKSFSAQLKAGPVCDRPIWVPRQVRDNYIEATGQSVRFENRPVEDRIAGLNGCEIVYSVLKMGMTQTGGVSRVTDEGRRWAAQYEDSVIDQTACPIMSQSLSNWVQAQPLTKFEPAPNPFIAFRDNGPLSNSVDGWREHLYRVATHYSQDDTTFYELSGEDCRGYVRWLRFERFGTAGDSFENYVIRLAQHTLKQDGGEVLCSAVPGYIYAPYSWKRDITARKIAAFEKREAERREAWKRFEDSVEEASKWKPTYRPPSGEPRCYRTSEKYETCFSN